jgi:hypothetical protein
LSYVLPRADVNLSNFILEVMDATYSDR